MLKELLANDPTVAELAIQYPAALRAFEQLGIDYCCGGQKPLSEAARSRGLTVDQIAEAVEAAAASAAPADTRNWREATLTELADHIEATHHVYIKSELPRLTEVCARVVNAHGESHGEALKTLQETYEGLRAELEAHLAKEEAVLFPLIRERESGEVEAEALAFPIEAPISVMELEHDRAGDALARMRAITKNYSLPPDACPTFHNLYKSLEQLERDTHRHIHLENNILFPGALAQGALARVF
jgi:regulator of cell morphogenesis and NO signaling